MEYRNGTRHQNKPRNSRQRGFGLSVACMYVCNACIICLHRECEDGILHRAVGMVAFLTSCIAPCVCLLIGSDKSRTLRTSALRLAQMWSCVFQQCTTPVPPPTEFRNGGQSRASGLAEELKNKRDRQILTAPRSLWVKTHLSVLSGCAMVSSQYS